MVPQESIAKTIEEKVTGEQRRYLLNELLKAIKKVLQPLFSFCFFIHLASRIHDDELYISFWIHMVPWLMNISYYVN